MKKIVQIALLLAAGITFAQRVQMSPNYAYDGFRYDSAFFKTTEEIVFQDASGFSTMVITVPGFEQTRYYPNGDGLKSLTNPTGPKNVDDIMITFTGFELNPSDGLGHFFQKSVTDPGQQTFDGRSTSTYEFNTYSAGNWKKYFTSNPDAPDQAELDALDAQYPNALKELSTIFGSDLSVLQPLFGYNQITPTPAGSFTGMNLWNKSKQAWLEFEIATTGAFKIPEIYLFSARAYWYTQFFASYYTGFLAGSNSGIEANGQANSVTGFGRLNTFRYLGAYDSPSFKPVVDITPAMADGKYHKIKIDLAALAAAQASYGNTFPGAMLKEARGISLVWYAPPVYNYPVSVSGGVLNMKIKNLRVGYYADPVGVALNAKDVLASDTSFSFGIKQKTESKALTVTGVGKSFSTILTVTGTDASVFKLTGGATISANQSKTFLLTYNSTVGGIHTAKLTLTEADGDARTITVTGTTSVPVTSISLPVTSAVTTVGGTLTLTGYSKIPVDATIDNIVWSASSTIIGINSSTGVVSALAAGVVTITATATAIDGSTASATLVVTITDPTSGVEGFGVLAVSLSPNPVASGSVLAIAGLTSSATVTFTNVYGSVVSSSTISGSSVNVDLGSGLYFVTIVSGGKASVSKVIVE